MEKKASIVVTLYNGSRFILEQLESLRIQTYTNIEVIIADDVSKDNGMALVEKFIKENGLSANWKLIVNSQNKGYLKNFLETAALTTGDVIFFCDQDDVWNANKVEIMMQTLDEHLEVNMLCSNLVPFTEENGARKLNPKFLSEMKDDGTVDILGMVQNIFHCKRSGCTMCIRRSYYDQIIPYWISSWAHDEFVWKMACIDNCCGIVHRFTTNRRLHFDNVTNIKERTRDGRIKQLWEMIECNDSLLKYAVDRNADRRVVEKIKKYKKSLQKRTKLLISRNPIIWLSLWKNYAECYPRRTGLFLDLYLVFFKTCKMN